MKRLMALAVTAVLTACGGGGSDSDSASPVAAATSSAEGFWNGTTTGGSNVSLAILENGETWGIFASGNSLVGAIYGNTQSSGGTLSGSGSVFDFVTRTGDAGTYTGTFSSKNTLSLTTNDGTQFSGAYGATYDQPASLADLAGTYSGFGVTVTTTDLSIPVTISAGGAISGSLVSGNLSCSAAGTATPRASGKNIFDIQLTFTGSICVLGDGATTAGIAFFDKTSNQLGVITLNPAKSDGLLYIGTR